jgi:hypothetical protein
MRALIAAALLAVASPAAAQEQEEVVVDRQHAVEIADDGDSYRVGFDPGTRVVLGGGYAPGLVNGDEFEADRGYVEAGVAYRHRWDFDDGVSWKLSHRILEGRLLLADGAGPDLTATAYAGQYIRWSKDGKLTFPPDTQVPFPFDIGFTADLGALRYRDRDPGFGVELGVVKADIVINFLRSRELRTAVQLGFGPRYEVRLFEADPEAELVATHLVAPFTAGTFLAHHESANGHHAFHLEASPTYALRIDETWAFSARARASYELVFLAINDLPLSAYFEAAYAHDGSPAPGLGEHEVRAAAGLRASIPLVP